MIYKYRTTAGLLVLLLVFACSSERKNVTKNVELPDPVDVTTMATPFGGVLKPAENGPVRSALGQPLIEIDSFTLTIKGLVASPFTLSWQDILEWKSVYTDTMLMYCVEGWEVWGNWKGILVKELLDRSGLKENAGYILFHCADGYTTALPIKYLLQYNAILAFEVNNKFLKFNDGYPLRLIAFGKFGYKWAKWVNAVEVIEQTHIGYWESFGYTDEAEVPLARRAYYEGSDASPLRF